MSLTHRVRTDARTVTVLLSGRIDRDAQEALQEAYADAAIGGPDVVVLDLTEVDYINSSGIALIVGLLGTARAQGSALRATGLSDHYRHIFDITRLSDFIEVVGPGA